MKNWLFFTFFFTPMYILGMNSSFSQDHRIGVRSTSNISCYRETANTIRQQRRQLYSSLKKHQANVSKVQTKSDSLPARNTDFITTTPSAIINISPEVDFRVRDRLSVLDGVSFETFEQRVRAVGAILEDMEHNGELTPVQKQNLLARGIRTYLRRLSDPVGIVKDQLHFMLNVACFSCGIVVDYHFPTQAAIERRKEQIRAARSLFSSENLSKIPAEHWVDLIATIMADVTFTGGVSATISYLKQVQAFGKGSTQCMKLAQKVERRVALSGIKLAKSVEDRIARAAALGEEVVTCDGIVLQVPPELGEASVLNMAAEDASSLSTAGIRNVQKVANMDKFFNEFEFGNILEKNSIKTKYVDIKTNSQIYEITKKLPQYGLKKGDQVYLDKFHGDHIEVFRGNRGIKVLNLDGSINDIKTAKTVSENRVLRVK